MQNELTKRYLYFGNFMSGPDTEDEEDILRCPVFTEEEQSEYGCRKYHHPYRDELSSWCGFSYLLPVDFFSLSEAAVAYEQEDLQKYCLGFIENHTQEVVQTKGFLELSEVAMQTILQSNCLTIDEVKLVHAVREWAHVGSAVLGKSVRELAGVVVPGLRLALLSPSELTALEKENRKDQMFPVESLAEAWKTHALWKGRSMRSSLSRRQCGTFSLEHHYRLDPQHK